MLVVVSPHLDDGVFSCGALLAAHPGSVVITVLSAAPDAARMRTEWDALCGHADAGTAINARKREDEAALAEIGATPRWLDFVDSQYGGGADETAIAGSIAAALIELGATRVHLPLGLFHADHRLVHDAAVKAVAAIEGIEVWLYEDAIYRAMPGLLEGRLAEFPAGCLAVTATEFPTNAADADRKARAVRCYASQAPALGANGMADAARPERYWQLLR